MPFDVGRPILRSVEASVALSLSTRMQAVIGLPLANPDDRQVFVLVRAAPVESSDPEETAQP